MEEVNGTDRPGGADKKKRRGHGVRGRSGPPGNANARKHGLNTLKRTVSERGLHAIDQRTVLGRALSAWRNELVADLGGLENISTQELALVGEAVKTKLLLDSVDGWLLIQPTLINKRTRSVLPVVRDRLALVATLRGLLGDLGLARRTKAGLSLSEYLASGSASQSRQGGTR